MTRKPMICHIDRSSANFASSEITPQSSSTATATPEETLIALLEPCRRCRELSDELTGWSENAAAILSAAIPVRRFVDQHHECVEALLEETGTTRTRKLSSSKLDLLCIYVCRPVSSEEKRKKCSKLGMLLGKAHAENVGSNDVRIWLKGVRLTDVTRKSAKCRPQTKFVIRFPVEEFPQLAAAVRDSKGWPSSSEAAELLEEAARRCEELLRSAASPIPAPEMSSTL